MKIVYSLLICLFLSCALNGRSLAEPVGIRQIKIGKESGVLLASGKVQIVLDENSPGTTRFAAKELSELLGTVLGAPVSVVTQVSAGIVPIYLGACSENDCLDISRLDRDGYCILIKDGAVHITGHDDLHINVEKALHDGIWPNFFERGTLFGVYAFLERFAQCRFYFPGRLGTILPQQDKIELPAADISDRPDWPGRHFYGFYTACEYFEGENRRAILHPGKNLQLYRLRMSTQIPLPTVHGTTRMRIAERFGKTNPEYFGLKEDGTRDTATRGNWGCMLCFSSNVFDEIYEDYKAMFSGDVSGRPGLEKCLIWGPMRKQWIDRRIMDVMPGDAFVKCCCPKCQAAFTDDNDYATNLIWDFVARMGRRLQADGYDDVVLVHAAYYPYQAVPAFDLPSNLEVEVDVTGPYDACNPQKMARDNELIKNWSKKIGKKVMLANFGYKRGQEGIPNPTPRAYANYYKDQVELTGGVTIFYNETDRFLYTTLQDYVFSKMAWDNSTDYEKVFDEYYADMFAAAAPIMRKTMERFEDIWLEKIGGRTIETDIGPISSYPSTTEIWSNVYDEKMMALIEEEFNCAEKLAAGIHRERVQLFRREFLEQLKQARARWLETSSLPEGIVAFENIPVLLVSQKDQKPAPFRTYVTCTRTDRELIVNFDCEETNLAKMSAADRKADDAQIWQDNGVEIFLNPDGSRKYAYHLIVNSRGVLSDAEVVYHGKEGTYDWKHNTNSKAKIATGNGKWSAEVRIPLASLPDMNPEGFPVNFCRSRIVYGEEPSYYTWSPLVRRSFGEIELFGCLRFSKPLVQNYSFASSLAGSLWGAGKSGAVERDEEVYFTAPASLKLVSDKNIMGTGQTIDWLKPGTCYRLSCMIKTDSIQPVGIVGGACLKFQDATGRQVWMPKPALGGTNDWLRYSCEFRTVAEMSPNPMLNLWIYNGKGTAWMDDVVLEEIK